MYIMADRGARGREFRKRIGAELASRRTAMGISQSALADELSLDQSAVSRGENGDREFGLFEILDWMDALGYGDSEKSRSIIGNWNSNGARTKGYWKNE